MLKNLTIVLTSHKILKVIFYCVFSSHYQILIHNVGFSNSYLLSLVDGTSVIIFRALTNDVSYFGINNTSTGNDVRIMPIIVE